MKFSRNLISRFIDISNINDEILCKTLNDIGLEVENKQDLSVPNNVVIGLVVEKTKHHDADKLNICKVDIGSEVLQIVCGAKNVAKGQYVCVALIGTKLDKLKIKKSTIRGVESAGMICSSTELGLPKINDGILVLDSSIGELELGKEICRYSLFNDTLFEVGVTPNRGDWLSLIGIARDLAAALNLKLNTHKEKEIKNEITPGIGRILNVSFDNTIQSSLCYKVAELDKINIDITTQISLALCDNLQEDALLNLLAFTTYMTGVIINAYKFDAYDSKISNDNKKIHINIKKDSNGVENVYYNDNKLYSIGISSDEKNYANQDSRIAVFEASFIPANYISEIVFNNKIESSSKILYLSKRGSSPLIKDGMEFLCNLLSDMSLSVIYSSSQDIIQDYPIIRIDCSFEDINKIIGNKIKHEEITDLLKKMDFVINSAADDSFIAINPPLYRQDIHSLQDVAEEILRLRGIDKITSIPQKFIQKNSIDSNYHLYKAKRFIAYKAIANRFFECVHYVFYKKEILQSYGYEVLESNLDITNPITSDLNTLRTSLIPAMLDSVARNKNYGYSAIRLFEIGSIYNKKREEMTSLAFVVSGNRLDSIYPNPKGIIWDFYTFASTISDIIGRFTLESSTSNTIYHKNICAKMIKDGKEIGFLGKLNPFIANKLEISEDSFVCEICFDYLFSSIKIPMFSEFSRFQSSQRDITILLDKNITFREIKKEILSQNLPMIKNILPLDLYKSEELGEKVSLSFRIIFQSINKTLSEDELKIDHIVELLESKFGATLK